MKNVLVGDSFVDILVKAVNTIYDCDGRFEKCGIISSVRTHLRQNLVNALKSKDATLNKDYAGARSARQYVYDLLVAEYLWNHNYAYTLSVFASEAPLLVNFCKHFPQAGRDTESGVKQKLQKDYVQHTLETLGIKPDDPAGLTILSDYATNDVPLLLCILKSLSLVNTKAESMDFHNCQTQTNSEYRRSLEISKVAVAKRILYRQKENFGAQLREKESELKQQAVKMEQQMAALNEKLAKAQVLMNSVHLKEKQIDEEKDEVDRHIYWRQVELSTKQDLLAREAERLQKERDNYKRFEYNLKKLQDELLKVKKELPGRETDKNFGTRDMHVQTDSNALTAKKMALNRERMELSSLVKVQQSRIEELTLRVVSLTRQLEEAELLKKTSAELVAPVIRFSKRNNLFSDSSSTEDILQDAKLRLKRLEEESLKADQCYFNCITTSPL